MGELYKVAVVGSGPAGLSAAGHAARCNVSHLLLERTDHASDTIYKYQKGKFVMATPDILPLRSDMLFQAGKREEVLGAWDGGLAEHKVNVEYNAEVTAIQKNKNHFELKIANGSTVLAENVILSIGLQGNVNKLRCDGADLPLVQYQLDDPAEYEAERIVIIGAGDAAIENAVALAEHNTVSIVNRRDEFARAKQGNLSLIQNAVETGRINCYYKSSPARVEKQAIILDTADGEAEVQCDRIIARLGASPPRNFVEACGVEFPSDDRNALPEVSASYESNVPGLFVIGALGGYPLIKQAMNQGYEVIEYILGNNIAPADQPLLEEKFAVMGDVSVDDVLGAVRKSIPIFSELNQLLLREAMLDSSVHRFSEGEVIFERNDYSNTFHTILSGNVCIQIDPDDSTQVVSLDEGDFFGEMGLISGRRRTATVMAASDCIVFETPRRTMLKLIQSVPSVRRTLDSAAILRQIQTHLAPGVSEDLLKPILDAAEIQEYKAGQPIFSEGDPGEDMHLIRNGSVTVSRRIGGRDVVLNYVPSGNYIGEMSLLSDLPRSATVKAANLTETICIEGQAFKDLMDKVPEVKASIENKFLDRLKQNELMESQPESGNLIQFLVEQGIGEATDVLLIDESLCIHCDNCEKACAETHGGISRLNREAGPSYASIHVPTSCRHCEHPHCMADCPPDAIHRATNGEVFIDDSCIGCGNCERNCPYGVIQMAKKPDQEFNVFQWLLFGKGPGPGEAMTYNGGASKNIDLDDTKQKTAVKCDMCKDVSGGASCVRSCPTGAAIRVSPEQFLSIASSSEQR